MGLTFETDKTKDKTFKILCSSCKNNTKHKVLTSINEKGSEPWDEYYSFQWDTDYEIIQCLGCETVSFRSYSINSEHDDHEGSHSDSRHHDRKMQLGHFPLTALLKSKTFMIIAAIAVFVAALILIAVVILLFPLLKRGFEYFNSHGIKGIMDAATPWLNTLWQGNK